MEKLINKYLLPLKKYRGRNSSGNGRDNRWILVRLREGARDGSVLLHSRYRGSHSEAKQQGRETHHLPFLPPRLRMSGSVPPLTIMPFTSFTQIILPLLSVKYKTSSILNFQRSFHFKRTS